MKHDSRIIWQVATNSLYSMLRNPAFSTIAMEDAIDAAFQIAHLMHERMNLEFPDEVPVNESSIPTH